MKRGSGRARLSWALLGGLGLLLVAGLWLVRDPRAHFAARRGALTRVAESPRQWDGVHWVQVVRLVNDRGLAVTLTLTGDTTSTPRPLFLLLGGHRTGQDAARLVPDVHGFLVAALAYPFTGNHHVKGLAVARELPAIRRAIRDTPPAIQLALDYLTRRSDVDARRVEGVGVSLGAPFMTIAAALDTRITRLWIVHGSGGVYTPIEHALRRSIPRATARVPIAALASVLAGGPAWAPERWVGQVAPRPVVLIAARDDERLSRAAIESLWRSAREPRRLVWLTGGHVSGRSSEQVAELATLLLGMTGE